MSTRLHCRGFCVVAAVVNVVFFSSAFRPSLCFGESLASEGQDFHQGAEPARRSPSQEYGGSTSLQELVANSASGSAAGSLTPEMPLTGRLSLLRLLCFSDYVQDELDTLRNEVEAQRQVELAACKDRPKLAIRFCLRKVNEIFDDIQQVIDSLCGGVGTNTEESEAIVE